MTNPRFSSAKAFVSGAVGRRTKRHRARLIFGIVALILACLTSGVHPASAVVSGADGEITFFRQAPGGDSAVYTVNPDGSHEQLLYGAESVEHPRWSPDGTQVGMECDSCGALLIVNPDTGSSRLLPKTDPTIDLGCGFFAWSPDGTRIACTSFNDDSSRDGIYTMRSSDGGGLTRVTTFGLVGDYSPDGKRISLTASDADGNQRLYVVKLNGGPPTPITPADLPGVNSEDGGSWSPTGNHILFAARLTPDSRKTVWIVNADGSGLHELSIAGCGGLLTDPTSTACDTPVWSPDGTKIAFSRYSAKTRIKNIYTVNADGTDLFQVTHNGFQDFSPDWGTHPLAH